jgi:hypothetical protein
MSATTSQLAAARRLIPAKRPHKFTKKRLEAWKFAPATPRGRSAHSGRPLKTPDALLNSVDAQIFQVADAARALFIVRPPPSVVPPTIVCRLSTTTSTPVASPTSGPLSHPLAAPTPPLPPHLPSPALRRPSSEALAPLSGASRHFPEPRTRLTADDVAALRAARAEEPNLSRRSLAQRFNCHPDLFATAQYDPSDPRSMALHQAAVARRAVAEAREEASRRNRRGDIPFVRQLALAERDWRRSLW